MSQEAAVVVEEQKAPEAAEDVSLPSLSDAELDAAISQSEGEKETEPEAAVKPEAKTPEVKPKEPEKETSEMAVLKAEVEKLAKQLKDKDAFISRQGNEIGDLRRAKQFYEQQAADHRKRFNEEYLVDPAKAMDSYNQSIQAQRSAQQMQAMEVMAANKATIDKMYPEYPSMIDDIVEYGKSIGVPPSQIENFKQNPYGTDPGILIPYVEGAKLMKKAQYVELIKKQVAELDEMGDEDTVSRKIAAATQKGPGISAGLAGSTGKGRAAVTVDDVSSLSDAELDALLKEK